MDVRKIIDVMLAMIGIGLCVGIIYAMKKPEKPEEVGAEVTWLEVE